MDELFWYEAYGDKATLLEDVKDDKTKRFAIYNYGPWDRLDGNSSFVSGIGEKPLGANFYPADMTKAEFEKANLEHGESLYTFIRRDENGNLKTIWYHEMFEKQVKKAAELLRQAESLAKDGGFKKYLAMRADALENDDYLNSDFVWMAMKENMIDVVIGPIENYEDQLFGYKAAHEAYVLIKDMSWSKRLEKYAAFLPELQKTVPYFKEMIAKMNWKDQLQYSGDANPNRESHKHERFKYRFLSAIENKLLGGKGIGGFKNYDVVKDV